MADANSQLSSQPNVEAILPLPKSGTEQQAVPPLLAQIQPVKGNRSKAEACRPDQTSIGKTILEICAVAVAAGAVSVYYLQLKVMNRQLDQMRSANAVSGQAAYAACLSAQLAAKALDATNNGSADVHNLSLGSVAQASATTRAEGAQIDATIPAQLPDVSAMVGHGMPYRLENVGKSAAIQLRSFVELRVVKSGTEPDFTYARGNLNWRENGTLSPGIPSIETAWFFDGKKSLGFTQGDVADISTGKSYVYMYGTINYTDIFGVRHWSHFCNHFWGQNNNTGKYPKCFEYQRNDTSMLLPIDLKPVPPAEPIAAISCKKPAE